MDHLAVILLLLSTASVLTLVGATGQQHEQHPPRSEVIDSLWESVADATGDAVESWTNAIHLYFAHVTAQHDKRREAALTACAHHLDLQDRLDCAINIRRQTPIERAAIRVWRATLDPYMVSHAAWLLQSTNTPRCFEAWDAVHCRSLPTTVVQSLLGLKQSPSMWRKKRPMPPLAESSSAAVYSFVDEAVTLPLGVSFVSGVHKFHHQQQSVQPHSKRLPLAEEAAMAAAGEALLPSNGRRFGAARPPLRPTAGSSEGNGIPGTYNFDFPEVGGSTPLVLGASITSKTVTAVFRCGDARPSVYHNGMPTCPQSAAGAQLNHVVVSTSADTSTFNQTLTASHRFTLADWSCSPGEEHVSTNASDAAKSTAVCYAPLPMAANHEADYQSYARVDVSVGVFFANGSNATLNAPSPYFASTVYEQGVLDPATNTTLNRVPRARIAGVSTSKLVTPRTIRTQYGIPSKQRAAQVVQGAIAFTNIENVGTEGYGFDINDLKLYLQDVAGFAPEDASDPPLHIIGNVSAPDTFETSLDLEAIMAMAPGAATYLYSLEYGPGAAFATYPDAFIYLVGNGMANQQNQLSFYGISQVWSISYGGPEWGDADQQFMHLHDLLDTVTGSGVSITASSGDDGSFFVIPDPDGAGAQFYRAANFPAVSPYVVGVGATSFLPQLDPLTGAYYEDACSAMDGNVITSGGGFSDYLPVPEYQKEALKRAGLGSIDHIGTPDISAVGAWIAVVANGYLVPIFGTSASSPIFAGMVSLLIQERRDKGDGAAQGNGAIHYLPEFVYQLGATAGATTDIVIGDNCAGMNSANYSAGFAVYARTTRGGAGVQDQSCWDARPGWDPVTGQGIPVFHEAATLALRYTKGQTSGPSPSDDASAHKTVAIVLGVLAVAAVLGALVAFYMYRRRQQGETNLSNLGYGNTGRSYSHDDHIRAQQQAYNSLA